MLAFVEHRYPALWPWIQLMRLEKPIGSMLLMWPTLWALWIAGGGTPSLKHIVIFVLGVFVMRAAGCVINDFADRDFDGHVTRTRGRPLATGALSARQALMLFAALGLIALGLVLGVQRFYYSEALQFFLELVEDVLEPVAQAFGRQVTCFGQLL